MRLWLLPILIAFLTSEACQSPPPKPVVHPPKPPQPVVSEDEKIDRYLNAKEQSSCSDFTALASDKTFVLHEVAQLRADEVCLKGPLDITSYPSWLRSTALEAGLASAEKRGDLLSIAALAIEKSKLAVASDDRLQWARLAKELFESMKLPDQAAEAERRIYLIAPRLMPQPQAKDYLNVADDFRYHRQFKAARIFYKRIIGSDASVPEKIAAYKGFRRSFKNARDDKSFLAANGMLVSFLEKTLKKHQRDLKLYSQLNDAMVLQARALWTRGLTSDAMAMLANAKKRLQKHWPLTDVYWTLAKVAEEMGDLTKSNAYIDRALHESNMESETKDKLTWALAWNQRHEKNYSAAVDTLQHLIAETENESTRDRAAFWLGKIKSEMNQGSDAQSIWEKLIKDDPIGYYGLLAYYQMDRPIEPARAPASDTPATILPTPSAAAVPLQSELADALIRVQEPEILQSYLDDVSHSYVREKDQDGSVWAKILQYYASAGLYIKLFENLNEISPQQRNAILGMHPELLFPKPFENEVRQATSESKVESELIYAIMRQESAFDPQSRSYADAFGLMQILPEQAADLSRKYSIPYESSDDLYDPTTNIRLGAALLKEQLAKYHDQFILAVASYNANDRAIQSWMGSRFHGDPIEFIEEIPYEETRGYVRLVMRNLIFYRLLASKDPMPFPKWVLKLTSL